MPRYFYFLSFWLWSTPYSGSYFEMLLSRDLTGLRFGLLYVLRRDGTAVHGVRKKKYSTWRCQCDCGELSVISRREFYRGKRYCSVLRHKTERGLAVAAARRQTQKNDEATYSSYKAMVQRCKPQNKYGKRGITVCERWQKSFAAFLEDVGPRPSRRYSIDRIDTFGNYEPGNCRWATVSEQLLNKRSTRWVEWKGEKRRLVEITRELGLDVNLIGTRLNLGWSLEKALSTPVSRRSGRLVEWVGEKRRLVDLVRDLGLDINCVGSRLKMGWDLRRALTQPIKRYKGKDTSQAEADLRQMSDDRVRKMMAGVIVDD